VPNYSKSSCLVAETPLDKLANPSDWQYTYFDGYKHLGAGLCVGLSAAASGLAIGICGEAGVKGMKHNDILIAVILLMIFAEAIALYGFIVAIVLAAA
jgi:V-type H+-transporting ATPase proteolipid subunit